MNVYKNVYKMLDILLEFEDYWFNVKIIENK